MGSLVLTGDTSGSGTITVPAVAGTFTATIGSATGTHYPFTAGTAVASTSGTSIDFTGIPSWVKRITVMFNGMSTSGTSVPLIQLGSGSVTTSGYLGSASNISSSVSTGNFTTGAGMFVAIAAASVVRGVATIVNLSGNTWVISGNSGFSDSAATSNYSSGVTLSGTLDRIRITTVNGTDTFDAGSINILYE